jgi:hypothetical protein
MYKLPEDELLNQAAASEGALNQEEKLDGIKNVIKNLIGTKTSTQPDSPVTVQQENMPKRPVDVPSNIEAPKAMDYGNFETAEPVNIDFENKLAILRKMTGMKE